MNEWVSLVPFLFAAILVVAGRWTGRFAFAILKHHYDERVAAGKAHEGCGYVGTVHNLVVYPFIAIIYCQVALLKSDNGKLWIPVLTVFFVINIIIAVAVWINVSPREMNRKKVCRVMLVTWIAALQVLQVGVCGVVTFLAERG